MTHPRDEVLVLDGVGVVLGGRRILEGVSLTVKSGEFIGLIGSNGAGKTTLLRVVLGLERTDSGRVLISADTSRTEPHTTNQPDRRSGMNGRKRPNRSIGYVPQKVVLDPDLPLRARDLVELGIDGHRFGLPLPSRARRQRVEEMLTAVGADAFADSRVGRLSGGELQRVLIAHALAGGPRLLLLDEPLANLDPRSSQEIVELLDRITSDEHVAVLLTAHEINPLLPVMDRIVYLANGRAATGTTEEVVRSDVLSSLYGHHVDVVNLHGRVLVVTGPVAPEREPIPAHPPIEVR